MKALILAAGYGTRLLPYTKIIPKPLFTLDSKPITGHLIRQLADIGCEHIIINTHHLHEQLEAFAKSFKDFIPITTIYEPLILDTGGAIANARNFLDNAPFFVINADIISSVNFMDVYKFHKESEALVTLVLHDYKQFNKIQIDSKGYIENFEARMNSFAFTGIQVLSPEIFSYFPSDSFSGKVFSSIDIYKSLVTEKKVKAYVAKNIYWSDIGTKDSYARASFLELGARAFDITRDRIKDIRIEPLAGDGSDRKWCRISYENISYIIGDHGICLPGTEQIKQLNAFICIDRHLFSKAVPVPYILNYDKLSGIVLMEDLGDTHLACHIKALSDSAIIKLYQRLIDNLINFSILGMEGFDLAWTCQTTRYSKELILEKECRYFMEAFVNGYLNLKHTFESLEDEFGYIADQSLTYSRMGLMHRDCQSRNIMIKYDKLFFIDFQAARIGPLQYDLASLLIDPYADLSTRVQNDLLEYTIATLKPYNIKAHEFRISYQFCSLTRNLQILGAFSFLSRVKQKKWFEQYIPRSVNTLKNIISKLDTNNIPYLAALIRQLPI